MTALFMAAILALSPRLAHDRAEDIARDIAHVVETEPPLFQRRENAGFLLVAVAYRESGFRESVETCRVKGDGGKSLGLWQTQGDRAVCKNRRHAARVAFWMLRRSLEYCVHLPRFENRLSLYTTGKCQPNWHSRDRFAIAEKLRSEVER